MENVHLDFLELIVQILQLPLIIFISVLCIRAKKVLNIDDLLWIGVAFIFNFLYLAISIYSHESLYKGLYSDFNYKFLHNGLNSYFPPEKRIFIEKLTNIIDDLTFILFLIPLYKHIGKNFFKPFIKKPNLDKIVVYKFLFYFLAIILSVTTIIYININSYYKIEIVNFIFSFIKALALFYLLIFFRNTKSTPVLRAYFLFTGFLVWSLVQFIPFMKLIWISDQYNVIGFGASFIAKICI